MDLGDAVLTLTVDENGLISGLSRAKGQTDDFVDDTKEQASAVDGSWALSFAAVAAGAAVAVAAFNKIIVVANEMLDAFAEQERATTTLTLALSTNKNVTDDTALALHNWAGEMQKSTIFGDEVIEQNLAMIAAMGMSEERIKEVMEAAMTLSSVYNIDLEQSVRGLALSLEAGTTGMLSRYVPALRTFTKEQLEAGAAINWTAEQFPHGAQIIGDTISGLQIRMANLVSDQKEKIGSALADSYRGVEGFMGMIETIGDVAAIVVGVFVKSLITLAEWFRWQYDVFIGFFKLLFQLIADVALFIWQPLQYGFQIVVQAIKIGFVTALNWILEQAEAIIRKIGEGLSNISGGLLGKNLISVDLGQINLVVEKVKPIGEALAKIWSDAKQQSVDFADTVVRGANNMANIWTAKAPSAADSIKKVQAAVGGLSDAVGLSVEETVEATRQLDNYNKSLEETAKQSDQAYSAIELEGILLLGQTMAGVTESMTANLTEYGNTVRGLTQEEIDDITARSDSWALYEKARDTQMRKEEARQEHLKRLVISTSKSIFESIGQDIAAGELSWASLGEAGVRAIGRIVSAIGDELAASAAADVVKGFAALASVLMAWAAPGLFESAAIKGIGAIAAWTTGAALQAASFAQGGEFTVPPGYPDDSFPMRVQSGEQVKVTPAGESSEGMIHLVVNLDSRPMLDAVTRASRNRRVLISSGSVVP